MDHILGHYGRLGLKTVILVDKAKKRLIDILDDPKEKGATVVQACKVIFWMVLNSAPSLLKDKEEIGSRDDAADTVLGKVPFTGDTIQ